MSHESWGDRRRNAAFMLSFGLLSLTCVSVRCFAISEHRHSFIPQPSTTIAQHGKFLKRQRYPPQVRGGTLFGAKSDGLDGSSNSTTPEDPMVTSVSPSVSKPMKAAVKAEGETLGRWPCLDDMDKQLIKISLPVIANFAINPLIGAVDLFWVNRMGNALAVAGQAAANQVFSSAFWFISFLPSGKYSSTSLMADIWPCKKTLNHFYFDFID